MNRISLACLITNLQNQPSRPNRTNQFHFHHPGTSRHRPASPWLCPSCSRRNCRSSFRCGTQNRARILLVKESSPHKSNQIFNGKHIEMLMAVRPVVRGTAIALLRARMAH
jgi:hypothetical protein